MPADQDAFAAARLRAAGALLLRLPAAFCGIYGHTPSETLVPHSGSFGTGSLPNLAVAMTVQGPLARSAEDLELVRDVIKGPDAGEEAAWHVMLPPARHERIPDFRIAMLLSDHMPPIDAEIASREGDDGSGGIDIPWDAVRALTDGAFAKHMSRMSQPSTMRLGRKLQRLRGMRGITAAELASRVGMTQPAISRIENGHHDVTSKTLEVILAALDYTLTDLASLDVEDEPASSVSA